jgi:hypothetical protein
VSTTKHTGCPSDRLGAAPHFDKLFIRTISARCELKDELLIDERRHDVADRRLALASNREHLVE